MVKNLTLMSRFLNNSEATKEFFDDDGYGFTGWIWFFLIKKNKRILLIVLELKIVSSYSDK